MFRAAIAALTLPAVLATPALAAHEGLAHVETRGEGDTHLLLVPGLLCDWTVWESFMERNAERYTMHAVTLPGFGGTEPPPEPEATRARPGSIPPSKSIAGTSRTRGSTTRSSSATRWAGTSRCA